MELSLSEARRVALAAQGFARERPARVDIRQLRRVLHGLALVQLDFVNVLVPAHYLVPFSRLGPYDRARFDELVYGRAEFVEQWAHEASIVPVAAWPLLADRRAAHRVRPWGFEKVLERNPEYVAEVLEVVRRRGAVSAADLPDLEGEAGRLGDAWGWTMNTKRQVLEAHFGFGRLAVAERLPSFARRYDLAERVVPPEHLAASVETRAAHRELVRIASRAHGVATVSDLADYFRMKARDVRPRVAELVEAGALIETSVEGWRGPAYLARGAVLPNAIGAAALLSPFDPLVWTRGRAERLFDFEYRLEIYVPKEKRRFGYYVLPFLMGEQIVARVDLKADRATGRLAVLASHFERGAKAGDVAEPLAHELGELARWLGLDDVHVGRRGRLASQLSAAVRQR